MDATAADAALKVSAFTSSGGDSISIVIVNTSYSSVTFTPAVSDASNASGNIWTTSSTQALEKTGTWVSGQSLTVASRTITTLNGTLGNSSSSSSVPQTAYSSAATIPGTVQMENYDNGGKNVAYYDSESGNSGNAYREDDVDIDTADAGASYVLGWLVAGEWTEYTVEVTSAGVQPFQARVASGGDGGSFHLELDGQAITSTVTVPNTGSWTTYQIVEGETETLSAGTHVLRFAVDGSYFNMDWIHFGTASMSIHPVESPLRTEKVVYRIFDIHGTYMGRVTASSSLECSSTIRRSYPAGIYVVRAMNGNGVQKIAVVP